MKARLSTFNQVVEVFEEETYDIETVYPNEKIVECDNSITPLMWYIDGKWLQESEYAIPKPSSPMTVDQLVDLLKWNGIEVYPL